MLDNENSAAAVAAQHDPGLLLAQHDPGLLLAQHDPGLLLARENADLRSRLAALERQNIVEGRFQGEAPRYYLNDPVFVDNTFFPAGSTIDYLDTPDHLAMVPLNDPAKRRMQDQIAVLEDGARRVAAKRGHDFLGLVTDRNVLIDAARADAKATAEGQAPVIAVPKVRGSVPPMPHTDEALATQRRGPGRPKRAVAVEAPAPSGRDLGTSMLAPAPAAMPGPAVVGHMVSHG